MKKNKGRSGVLVRNTLLNLVGQGASLFVGVAAVPFIIQGLGSERFGLLSLAWVVSGYLGVFELGLGRATAKFVAEALELNNEDKVSSLVWTAALVQVILGLSATLVLMSIIPIITRRILNIPSELLHEAETMFYLISIFTPVILVSYSFRGMLEAYQRFDLVNLVRIPLNVSIFVLPLVGLFLGYGLVGIIILTLLARTGGVLAFVIFSFRVNPCMKRFRGSLILLPSLLSFGGWVTVSSMVNPVLLYTDRFIIGSLISMGAVAYYSAPYEIVNRLRIIPASLTMTLFPTFSQLAAIEDWQMLGVLLSRSVKYILVILGPIVLLLGLFANKVLEVWLGSEFALQSTAVLQLLAFGILITCMAYIPYSLLVGIGHPDVPAKFHLLELFLYVPVVLILTRKWGIVGAAAAWTFRVTVDAFLLLTATLRISGISPKTVFANGLGFTITVFAVMSTIAWAVRSLISHWSLALQCFFYVVLVGLFVWVTWANGLDDRERHMIVKAAKMGMRL